MPITIIVDDIEIQEWTVNVERRAVHVVFHMLTDTDEVYQYASATFWETIPDPADYPTDDPSTWYQLPAQYSQVLTDLTVDARNALLPLVNPV